MTASVGGIESGAISGALAMARYFRWAQAGYLSEAAAAKGQEVEAMATAGVLQNQENHIRQLPQPKPQEAAQVLPPNSTKVWMA